MMGVLPSETGLPSFPLASSSMQLRALLVVLGGFSLTTSEHHSERFNTCLVFLKEVFRADMIPVFFCFLKFLRKKGCQGPPFYRFTLGHLANRHRSEHAASHFTSLTC